MFSDQPITPKRLEILVNVAEYGRTSTLRRDQLLELLQPETLPNYNPCAESPRISSEQALRAARDLGLIEEVDDGWIIAQAYRERRWRSTREMVLDALDARVLCSTEVEPYFALFYSYLLGLGLSADENRSDQDWASAFNEALQLGLEVSNPFNATKVRGLWRWLPYSGLGWADNRDVFQCDPYDRVRRAIPNVFGSERRLESDDFAARLTGVCPELDGGLLFRRANAQREGAARVFTLGLAQALVALHEDGIIVLECPRDSRGWDLSAAEPSNDGKTLRSARLDAVIWTAPAAKKRRGAGVVS